MRLGAILPIVRYAGEVEKWLEQATASSSEPPILEDDRPIWEIFAYAMRDVPREELALLPKDRAAQIDHYLYGHPKTN